MAIVEERVLILAKTYPSPSAHYIETSCVAGINEAGQMRRLFPVPYRLLEGDRQFAKWQWVTAKMKRATDDNRPESYRVFTDTIDCGELMPTTHAWEERRRWLERVPTAESFAVLEQDRLDTGRTLGLIRADDVRLEITEREATDWTTAERAKLLQHESAPQLAFTEEPQEQLKVLRKLPFDFRYVYRSGGVECRHKIADWEAGALYWNCVRQYGEAGWREKLSQRLEMRGRDLWLLMGTIHRFPNQWLITSIIYPPAEAPPVRPRLFE